MLAALPDSSAALAASVVTDPAIRAHAWAALRAGPTIPDVLPGPPIAIAGAGADVSAVFTPVPHVLAAIHTIF